MNTVNTVESFTFIICDVLCFCINSKILIELQVFWHYILILRILKRFYMKINTIHKKEINLQNYGSTLEEKLVKVDESTFKY